MSPDLGDIVCALDATWPAARIWREGPWRLSAGEGGGKRVSAARAVAEVAEADIRLAEDAMRGIGQAPLFMLTEQGGRLDRLLEARGYRVEDPTVALSLPVRALTTEPVPRLAAFEVWEPLAIMQEIWASGGIGPARLAVMRRAGTKTAILARKRDKPAGTAFVALHENIAMVHAVEVAPAFRREGVAGNIMRASAFWAARHGAESLVVLCTRANGPAQALYSALGFRPCHGYHYRSLTKEDRAHV